MNEAVHAAAHAAQVVQRGRAVIYRFVEKVMKE